MICELTVEHLRERLAYDPNTGTFTWKISGTRAVPEGYPAGSVKSNGYVNIRINGKIYLAHRLAWLYVYGRWPDNEIDHINHERAQNWILNLREVTHRENHQNRRHHRIPR